MSARRADWVTILSHTLSRSLLLPPNTLDHQCREEAHEAVDETFQREGCHLQSGRFPSPADQAVWARTLTSPRAAFSL
jgi:hypothetical protein